jgi:hypothetical protein
MAHLSFAETHGITELMEQNGTSCIDPLPTTLMNVVADA